MHSYLCMYVWVNASPRSPSSAAPCDNGQELLVCVDLYLALMMSHREEGSRALEDKGGRVLGSGYQSSSWLMSGTVRLRWVNNYSFLMRTVAGKWPVMTVPLICE